MTIVFGTRVRFARVNRRIRKVTGQNPGPAGAACGAKRPRNRVFRRIFQSSNPACCRYCRGSVPVTPRHRNPTATLRYVTIGAVRRFSPVAASTSGGNSKPSKSGRVRTPACTRGGPATVTVAARPSLPHDCFVKVQARQDRVGENQATNYLPSDRRIVLAWEAFEQREDSSATRDAIRPRERAADLPCLWSRGAVRAGSGFGAHQGGAGGCQGPREARRAPGQA